MRSRNSKGGVPGHARTTVNKDVAKAQMQANIRANQQQTNAQQRNRSYSPHVNPNAQQDDYGLKDKIDKQKKELAPRMSLDNAGAMLDNTFMLDEKSSANAQTEKHS